MPKRYIIDLAPEERAQLVALTRKGKASARRVTRAHVLLHAADGLKDSEIAAVGHTSVPTVARIRKRFAQGRVQEAITERYRKGGRPKLDLKAEAHLIALSCSTPPQGRKDWTMQLLADKLVEVGVVDEISDETVHRTLKKNRLKPWQKRQWCLGEVGADFLWRMEGVLDLYAEPVDPLCPVICLDECPYQLLGDVLAPVPLRPGRAARYDYEYKRGGTESLFVLFCPARGWRHMILSDHHGKQDFAQVIRWLVDEQFPQANVIRPSR